MNQDEHRFPCDVCGAETTEFMFAAKDKNRRVDNRLFSVRRCAMCGVGHTLPKLSLKELQPYYSREYYSLDNNLALERATRPHNRMRLERIQRYVTAGKLLDVGCGTGMFLKTAKEQGFDVEGVEISEGAAAFGRATWELTIHQGDLGGVTLSPSAFDVVTLGHVFEHLHEPRTTIVQCREMLRKGGLLVIAVPNFDSLQAKIFRSEWFHLDIPRHLFHFTPSGLGNLANDAGLRTIDVNFFSAEHNWAGILGSMMELSRPGESSLHKLVRKSIGVPIAKTFAFIESALGRGGTFEMYAVKL